MTGPRPGITPQRTPRTMSVERAAQDRQIASMTVSTFGKAALWDALTRAFAELDAERAAHGETMSALAEARASHANTLAALEGVMPNFRAALMAMGQAPAGFDSSREAAWDAQSAELERRLTALVDGK